MHSNCTCKSDGCWKTFCTGAGGVGFIAGFTITTGIGATGSSFLGETGTHSFSKQKKEKYSDYCCIVNKKNNTNTLQLITWTKLVYHQNDIYAFNIYKQRLNIIC